MLNFVLGQSGDGVIFVLGSNYCITGVLYSSGNQELVQLRVVKA